MSRGARGASTKGREFRVLGPLEVWTEGRSLPLGGAKQRALLAILLLHANQVVSSDRLIDLLWGEEPPNTAGKVLQVYVSQLRKLLDANAHHHRVLVTRPGGYLLVAGRDQLDLYRFEDLVADARRAMDEGIPAAAAARLREALGLWRGEPLAEFAFGTFAQIQMSRLEELRLAALHGRIEADLALGHHAEVIAELEGLLAADSTREPLARLLMIALYRAERQADALDVYGRVRTALIEELGIEPGPDLQDLHRRVLEQDASLRWVPPRSHPSPNNLPSQTTSFVGRSSELAAVEELLTRSRLITLTGPGGCGKSRLALELALRALPRRSHGVWFVQLRRSPMET